MRRVVQASIVESSGSTLGSNSNASVARLYGPKKFGSVTSCVLMHCKNDVSGCNVLSTARPLNMSACEGPAPKMSLMALRPSASNNQQSAKVTRLRDL